MSARVSHVAIASDQYALNGRFYESLFGMKPSSKPRPARSVVLGDVLGEGEDFDLALEGVNVRRQIPSHVKPFAALKYPHAAPKLDPALSFTTSTNLPFRKTKVTSLRPTGSMSGMGTITITIRPRQARPSLYSRNSLPSRISLVFGSPQRASTDSFVTRAASDVEQSLNSPMFARSGQYIPKARLGYVSRSVVVRLTRPTQPDTRNVIDKMMWRNFILIVARSEIGSISTRRRGVRLTSNRVSLHAP